jgi:hypothetical protein
MAVVRRRAVDCAGAYALQLCRLLRRHGEASTANVR